MIPARLRHELRYDRSVTRPLLPGAVLLVALTLTRVSAAETLVMVSPAPELDAAVRASLAPWRVTIIVVDLAAGTPAELALSQGAGYVVWSDQGELVLWDARAATGERRGIPAPLDDATAAALALSIKSWMRLGPPPVPDAPVPDGPVTELVAETPAPATGRERVDGAPAPPAVSPPRLRLEAGSGARANAAASGRTALRLAVAAAGRVGPVDVVAGVELGPSHPGGDLMTNGELATLAVTAHARWPFALVPAVTAGPAIGAVLVHTTYRGLDQIARPFAATGFMPGLDVAGVVEWRRGPLVVGAEVGATAIPWGQSLKDRNIRLDTRAHIEPHGLARVGVILW